MQRFGVFQRGEKHFDPLEPSLNSARTTPSTICEEPIGCDPRRRPCPYKEVRRRIARGGVPGVTAPSQFRILEISDDDGLRSSRAMVLRKEGYVVESMTSRDFLMDIPAVAFDVAVMCQSVEVDLVARIAEMLRKRNPKILVLHVNPFRVDSYVPYKVDTEVSSGPQALLDAIKALLGMSSSERSMGGVRRLSVRFPERLDRT